MRSARIKKPDGKRQRIKGAQSALDIVKQIRRAEYDSRDTSKKLAPVFRRSDDLKTCKLVWLFLRKKILYDREPPEDQTAKTIGRFISDSFGDCKHYATSAVGILNACNIPAWFVFISQNKYRRSPNHAYACALVNNKLVYIDPCKRSFGSEANYYHKYHVQPIKSNQYGFKLSVRGRTRRNKIAA